MAIAPITRLRGSGSVRAARRACRPRGAARCWARAQVPTFQSRTIATSASTENQATLGWPSGSTMKAASSGPIAVPVLPPTWNSDWAKP